MSSIVGRRRRVGRPRVSGKGFLDVIKKIGRAVADSKIISHTLPFLGHPMLGRMAGTVGLGRRRRRKPRVQGAGILSGILGTIGLGHRRRRRVGGKVGPQLF